jgi:5-methylcytosine-specific restriction endonuclease McrA
MNISLQRKMQIYNKTYGKCAYCGETLFFDKMHIDHIIPKSRFIEISKTNLKVNDINNLFPSCDMCNLSKHNQTVDEFRIMIQNCFNKLLKENCKFRILNSYGIISKTDKNIKFYFEELGLQNEKIY